MPRAQAKERPLNERQLQANMPARGGAQHKIGQVPPAVIRKEHDARNEEQRGMTAMPVTGEPKLEHPERVIEVGLVCKDKLEYERFMAEMVTVQIHATSEKDADPRFEIAVNNHKRVFVRGQEQTVHRYYVEGLARAKPTSYGNEEYIKPDGSRSVRWPTVTGVRYPFSVMHDPSGDKGLAWLKSVLKQP